MSSWFTSFGGNIIVLIAFAFLGFILSLFVYIFYRRTRENKSVMSTTDIDDNIGMYVTEDFEEDEEIKSGEVRIERGEYVLGDRGLDDEDDATAVYLGSFNDPFLTPLIEGILIEEGIEPFTIESKYDPHTKLKPGEKMGFSYTRMYVHKSDKERALRIIEDALEELKSGPELDEEMIEDDTGDTI